MPTSLKEQLTSITSLEDTPITPELLGYFDGASRDEAHDQILATFAELAQKRGITRAFLARRIGKSPEQITRLLGAPGNWTLETYAHLALAMGFKPKHGLECIADMRQSNDHHPKVPKALGVMAASLAKAGSPTQASYIVIQSGSGSLVLAEN